jgi:F-type H+-transporting ATPase subunit b
MTSLLADPEFYVLVSFVIFFALFGARLWAALTGLLDKRANDIRAELDEAKRLRAEAEAMLADAQRARTEALAEAAEMMLRSRAEAAQLAEAAAAETEAASRRRERMALDRIAAAEKAAIADVRHIAADIATHAAERAIREGLTADTATAILDSAIADLPRALRAA